MGKTNRFTVASCSIALTVGVLAVTSAFEAQARNPPRGPDFDRDGYDDMAIGVPNDGDSGVASGSINILYGSSTGPEAPSLLTLLFHQDTSGVPGAAGAGDYFGNSLAWGDFDGDGYDDLIIGVPYEDIISLSDAGYVNVLYGGSGGLSASGSQSFSGGFGSTAYDAAANDHFGFKVASGDFDGDGYDDVAVSASAYDDGATWNVGAVVVMYGSSGGLSVAGQQLFHQGSSGIAGDGNESSDYWGHSLVTGDFDCDGYEDLAVGSWNEEISGYSGSEHGAVTVIYGSNSGLSTTGSQWWHQGSTSIEGAVESDAFGWSLAAANFDGDSNSGRDCVDLAIGAPIEEASGYSANGSVNVIYGGTSGLTSTGDQILYQGNGLAGSLAASGEIGSALTVGRLNSDSYDDLVVGANEADPGGNAQAGEIYLAKGSSSGLTSTGAVRWDSASTNIPGVREAGDGFGLGVSFGWSEGDSGNTYLFVGAYGEDSSTGAICTVELDSGSTSFGALSGSDEWRQDDIEGTTAVNENFGIALPAPRLKARFAPM